MVGVKSNNDEGFNVWIETEKRNFVNMDTGAKLDRFIEGDGSETLKFHIGATRMSFSGNDMDSIVQAIRGRIAVQKLAATSAISEIDFYNQTQEAMKTLEGKRHVV